MSLSYSSLLNLDISANRCLLVRRGLVAQAEQFLPSKNKLRGKKQVTGGDLAVVLELI